MRAVLISSFGTATDALRAAGRTRASAPPMTALCTALLFRRAAPRRLLRCFPRRPPQVAQHRRSRGEPRCGEVEAFLRHRLEQIETTVAIDAIERLDERVRLAHFAERCGEVLRAHHRRGDERNHVLRLERV